MISSNGENIVLGELLGQGSYGKVHVIDKNRVCKIGPKLDMEIFVYRFFGDGIHVPKLIDCGLYLDKQFFLMQRAIGTLKDAIEHNILPNLIGVLDGLAYIHSQGIIHRDIKPDNIAFFGSRPMLIDFGMAISLKHARLPGKFGNVWGSYQYCGLDAHFGVYNKCTDLHSFLFTLLRCKMTLPWSKLCSSKPMNLYVKKVIYNEKCKFLRKKDNDFAYKFHCAIPKLNYSALGKLMFDHGFAN